MARTMEKVSVTITREDGSVQKIDTTDFILLILQQEQRIENMSGDGMSGVGVGVHIFEQDPIHAYALLKSLEDVVKKQRKEMDEYQRRSGHRMEVAATEEVKHVENGVDQDVDKTMRKSPSMPPELKELLEYLEKKLAECDPDVSDDADIENDDET